MDEVLRVVIHVLTGTAASAAVIFVIAYMRSPWSRNVTGRNTMAFMAVVAATLTTAVIFRTAGWDFPRWLSATVWALINWPLWWRVVILWRVQHHPFEPVDLICGTCGQLCGHMSVK